MQYLLDLYIIHVFKNTFQVIPYLAQKTLTILNIIYPILAQLTLEWQFSRLWDNVGEECVLVVWGVCLLVFVSDDEAIFAEGLLSEWKEWWITKIWIFQIVCL